VCVCERERVCVCVCARARKRRFVRDNCVCVCMCLCVCEREMTNEHLVCVCVCVHVCLRERERKWRWESLTRYDCCESCQAKKSCEFKKKVCDFFSFFDFFSVQPCCIKLSQCSVENTFSPWSPLPFNFVCFCRSREFDSRSHLLVLFPNFSELSELFLNFSQTFWPKNRVFWP
jgi:hypothetical protein